MDASILIGRMLAVIYLTVGIGMALNKKYYHDMLETFCDNKPMMYFGGISALTTGFLILTFHNTWKGDWTVLITLIGWIALFKGISILLFPEHVIKRSRQIMKNPQIAIIFAVGMGGFLGYYSFFVQ